MRLYAERRRGGESWFAEEVAERKKKKRQENFFFLGVTEYRAGYIQKSKWVGRGARESVELN